MARTGQLGSDGVRSTDPRIGEIDGRTRILDAALEEFANRGFDGATTAAIARRAGVTQPLVHYHFASKDELWRAAVTREVDAIVDHFGGISAELGDLDPVDRMKVLVRRLVLFMAEHPEFGRIMSYEGVQGGPRHQWILGLDNGDGRVPLFERMLGSGTQAGWAKPLPVPHVVSCIVASSAYFFQVRATMRDQYGLDTTSPEVIAAHADTVVELLFHGLVRTDVDGGAA